MYVLFLWLSYNFGTKICYYLDEYLKTNEAFSMKKETERCFKIIKSFFLFVFTLSYFEKITTFITYLLDAYISILACKNNQKNW